MLSEETIQLGLETKGSSHTPLLSPRKNGISHFIMNLKPLNCFITCTKFKMSTLKQIRGAYDWVNGQFHWTSNQHNATSKWLGGTTAFYTSDPKAGCTSSGHCLLVCPQPKDIYQNNKTNLAPLQKDLFYLVLVPR